jgi:protein TonB
VMADPEPVASAAPAPAPVVAKQEAPVVQEVPEVKEIIEPPRFGAAYLHNPPPDYPPLSRRVGEEGRVMLRVLVTKDGDAERVEIESGSGSSRLDKAALEAVKKWRFIPAKRNNQPISAYVIVPIQFTLNS